MLITSSFMSSFPTLIVASLSRVWVVLMTGPPGVVLVQRVAADRARRARGSLVDALATVSTPWANVDNGRLGRDRRPGEARMPTGDHQAREPPALSDAPTPATTETGMSSNPRDCRQHAGAPRLGKARSPGPDRGARARPAPTRRCGRSCTPTDGPRSLTY